MFQKSKIPLHHNKGKLALFIYGKNFMKTIINISKTKKTINVISDQIGSTSAHDLVECILRIIASERFNYYAQKKVFYLVIQVHVVGNEFAKEILLLTFLM